jgi:hypothetical protein
MSRADGKKPHGKQKENDTTPKANALLYASLTPSTNPNDTDLTSLLSHIAKTDIHSN